MATIINIETSTTVCSVALAIDGKVEVLLESHEGSNHSVVLGQYVQECLEAAKRLDQKIDAVAISMGPGSYTGLRIGVSMAKGLCYGMNIPLIAIPTLQAMAHAMAKVRQEDLLYVPMIDARRMEVYMAMYDINNAEVLPTEAKVIDEESFADLLDYKKLLFFGNGSDKLTATLVHPNAEFVLEIKNSASDMVALAEIKYQQEKFEDVAYFEPFYLKDFVATTPKKSILER